MKLFLKRTALNPSCTLGKMSVDANYFCNSLEDTYRDLEPDGSNKVYGKTCIPCGTYKCKVMWSNHFKKDMIHIMDVPNFDGILIHGGNTEFDTLGCVLCGAQTNGVNKIWDCAGVVDQLTDMVADAGECEIEISIA